MNYLASSDIVYSHLLRGILLTKIDKVFRFRPFAKNFQICTNNFRSSRTKVLYKKGVVKNFANFIEKRFCWSLYFNMIAGLMCLGGGLIMKETSTELFSYEFYESRRSIFFTEHLRWTIL